MGKKIVSVDELAKKAIQSNPMYLEDEPDTVGNPENLNKSDKEIDDEDRREAEQERSK